MTDPLSQFVVDRAFSGATSFTKRIIRAVTFDWRATRWVIRKGRAQGIRVSQKSLKYALADGRVRKALDSNNPEAIALARQRIASVIATDRNGNPAPTEELFDLIRYGYLGASEVNEAIVAHQIQADKQHAQTTETLSSIRETLDRDESPALFPVHLEQMNPTLGKDLMALQETFPNAVRRIASAVANADRGQLLEDWLASRPSWLPREADLDGWLGELASDSGLQLLAVRWFDSALELGASPRGYWKLRRLWASGESDDMASLAYLSDVAGHPLVESIKTAHLMAERAAHLAKWIPSNAGQMAMKQSLTARFAAEDHRPDDAIAIGREAFAARSSTGAVHAAIESLLRRSTTTRPQVGSSDLSSALEMALAMRDLRRQWGSASGDFVELAMNACLLLMDLDQAWSLSQPEPDGQATAEEARHPGVRGAAVMLMADRGSIEIAAHQLDETSSEHVRLQVRAREAELEDDFDMAKKLWSEAIHATDDWSMKASLCFRQATRGYVDPFVSELRENNPEIAEEIELVAALYAHDIGAESRIQRAAEDNPRLLHTFLSYLDEEGRTRELATSADFAAEKWSNPNDWLRAAQAYQRMGQLDLAIDRAAKALLAGGTRWGDRFTAYTVQVEAAYQLEDWPTAILAAKWMVDLRPDSSPVRWALVILYYRAGEFDSAYEAWSSPTPGPDPTDENQTIVWLAFFQSHGSEMASLEHFQTVVKRFQATANVRAAAVAALIRAPITEDELVDIGSLLAQYAEEFPNDQAFIPIDLGPDGIEEPEDARAQADAILEKIDAVMGGERPGLEDIEKAILTGLVPIGIVTAITSSTYAEALITNRRTPRFAGPLMGANEKEMVGAAHDAEVVVDTTALLTLALLPEDIAQALSAPFRLQVTSHQILDANAAKHSLAQEIAGRFIPSSKSAGPQFVPMDSAERSAQREISQRLVEGFRRARRQLHTTQTSAPVVDFGVPAGPWSSAADLANVRGTPFWCDDAATRHLAAASGTPAFGTPAVVEYLRDTGRISDDVASTYDASLLHHWSVGVSYRPQAFELALSLDGSRAAGLAAAIRYGGGDHADEKLQLVFRAMGEVLNMPEELQRWAHLAARYVTDISADAASARFNRLAILRRLLLVDWANASRLPFVLEAVKAVHPDSWADEFSTALREVISGLASRTAHSHVAQYFLAMTAQLPEADRMLAVSVVLER